MKKLHQSLIKFSTVLLIVFGLAGFVSAQVSASQRLKPGEIVYSRQQPNRFAPPTTGNQPTIWAVGQNGANDRQITTGTQPRISDDGRYLLFKRFDGNPANPFGNPYSGQSYTKIWLRNMETGAETLILDGVDYSQVGYYFSPESNRGDFQIIFHYSSILYRMNLDGANPTPLEYTFGTGSPRLGDYFPVIGRGQDGRVAMSTTFGCVFGSTGCRIWTRTVGSEVPVVVPNTSEGDNNPSWSNDNQFIGFATIDATRQYGYNTAYFPYFFRRLSKIRPDGTGKTALVDINATDATVDGIAFGTVWSDDNTRIFAAARINGVAGLFAFKTDGSGNFTRIPISPAGNAPDFVGGIVQRKVDQSVVALGGGVASNGSYSLVSTIGETIAGLNSSGGGYSFDSGFWATTPVAKRNAFDFDGDGRDDTAVFRPANGTWYISPSSANGGAYSAVRFGVSDDKVTPADFDGDGVTDIAVWRDGANGRFFILQSSTSTVREEDFGIAGDNPGAAVGDWDGDGKADVAVYRDSVNYFFYRGSNNNPSGNITYVKWGAPGDIPLRGDFDGDGRLDATVFRPSNGVWYILNSAAGTVTYDSWGLASDRFVQSDYDGDGRTDPAVYRNGVWYLKLSSGGIRIEYFGAAGDQPAPADYDGDGKSDIAVVRSGANWFVKRSSDSVVSYLTFGTSGDVAVSSVFVR